MVNWLEICGATSESHLDAFLNSGKSIAAFASATHDIAADGYYMLAHDKKSQATAPVSPVEPATPAPAVIENRGEFVAAVSAALAEELGTDVTGIRILSIKKASTEVEAFEICLRWG